MILLGPETASEVHLDPQQGVCPRRVQVSRPQGWHHHRRRKRSSSGSADGFSARTPPHPEPYLQRRARVWRPGRIASACGDLTAPQWAARLQRTSRVARSPDPGVPRGGSSAPGAGRRNGLLGRRVAGDPEGLVVIGCHRPSYTTDPAQVARHRACRRPWCPGSPYASGRKHPDMHSTECGRGRSSPPPTATDASCRSRGRSRGRVVRPPTSSTTAEDSMFLERFENRPHGRGLVSPNRVRLAVHPSRSVTPVAPRHSRLADTLAASRRYSRQRVWSGDRRPHPQRHERPPTTAARWRPEGRAVPASVTSMGLRPCTLLDASGVSDDDQQHRR